MNKTARVIGHVCILLAISFVVGCSDDDPAAVNVPVVTNPAGSVGVYANADGTGNTVIDTGALVTLYVVHTVTDGAMASSFKIEAPAGWVRISAQPQFAVAIGDVDAGISVGYGSCLTGATNVVTLTYQSPGNSVPGAMFRVLPHSGTPANLEVVDCSQKLLADGIGRDTPVSLP